MRIGFFPRVIINQNKYVKIMISILNDIEHLDVCDFTLKDYFYCRKNIKKIDLFWLNWYENNYTFLKICLLFFLKKVKKKNIIYVAHNKKPHDIRINFLTKILMKSLYYFSYKIIIHSKDSMSQIPAKFQKKAVYIPHPNYISEYGEILPTNNTKKLRLLFLGLIQPYKNIELIVKSISDIDNNLIELTIAGKPISEKYKNRLETFITKNNSGNIHLNLKFIEHEKVNFYLSNCDLLVLPYDLASYLNSGTVMLAFSYKKTVICPEIATLKYMEQKSFLTYTYNTTKEHKIALKKKIKEAIDLKKDNIHVFDTWGERMYKEVYLKNSRKNIKYIIEEEILKNL